MTEVLRQYFNDVDEDEDGKISFDEASFAMQFVGRKGAAPEEIFNKIDTDKDGKIDFGEFVKLVDESANAPLEVPIRKSSRAEKERTTSEGSDGAPGHPARNRTTSDGDSKDHKDVKDESKQRKESIFRRGLRQLSMGDSKA